MMRALISAYPWDLTEGVDPLLDRLHGEVGVTGLAWWGAGPEAVQLRRRTVEPRIFRTRGGLFFPPAADRYEATRIKPIVSEWAKGREALGRIADACDKHGLRLHVMLSAAATGRLAERHPEAACKNVFGDPSQRAICLCNGDVQAYLRGLVADLGGRPGVAGVVLTDFFAAWPEALSGDVNTALPLGEVESLLLGLCFCESCLQTASDTGVDAVMARRSAEAILQKCLDAPGTEGVRVEAVLGDNPPFAAYRRRQGEVLSELLARLVEDCGVELAVRRPSADSLHSLYGPSDWSGAHAAFTQVDRVEHLGEALSVPGGRRELFVPARCLVGSDAPKLVAMLTSAVEQGCEGVMFDDLGALPDAALTTIKQGLRYARRIAGGEG